MFLFEPSVFLDSGDLADLDSAGFSGGGGGGVWGRTHRPTGGRRAKIKKIKITGIQLQEKEITWIAWISA